MKFLLKLFVLLLLLVVIALVGVLFYLDAIVKSSVERGATIALGVETTLDSADLEILGGSVELDGLAVANPEGFEADHFLTLDETEVVVTMKSLRQPVVHVPKISLEDLHVVLERRDGKANYQHIMDNLGRFKRPGKEPSADEAEGKRYIIDELSIEDTRVDVQLLPVGGSLTTAKVELPVIKLEDIGAKDGKGVLLSELSGIIVQAVLEEISKSAGDRLPSSILAELDGGLDALGNLGEFGLGALEDLKDKGGTLGDFGRDLKENSGEMFKGAGEKAGDATGKALEGAGKFLEGLGTKMQAEGEEAAADGEEAAE